eukprot:g27807.t1
MGIATRDMGIVLADGGDDVKSNPPYVHEAFEHLFVKIKKASLDHGPCKLREVTIFSDGGPNHFKLSPTIAMFSTWKAKHNLIRLRWFFFAAYHGRSMCDAHAGVVGHALNAMAFNEDRPWHNVDELIAEIKEKCSRVDLSNLMVSPSASNCLFHIQSKPCQAFLQSQY